jgi:protein-S-isoprenylcysteine O-methyltransferase Ste14
MEEKKVPISPRAIIQMLIMVVLIPLAPLLISRRWDWWEAWAYAGICILGFAISRWLAAKRNPDLIGERARFLRHEDTAPWDRVLAPLVGLGGSLIPVAAGFDALYNWPPAFGLPLRILALVIILAGYALGAYALIENRFFSGVVRIQAERGHSVISSGPYRWVRHPGYSSGMLSYLAGPLLLGSYWAMLPAVLLLVVLVIRTRLEDRYLLENLEGYREYAGKVRYRLLPGIW